ncbi:hypothetical protein [Methylobacillus sp.]|uniref:hypothetical protein n=1 Tax=Methylobacillus sp. TaxID=56818 RepID=UPI0012CEB22A|nr:hypothetical protein [Methylobacillus sp.]MPS48547.1 hypothetical protein [Methylobacillus sp.]
MPIVKLRVPCTIYRRSKTDRYGQPALAVGKPTKCAVVLLSRGKQASTVRSDSSATRGHAEEPIANCKLLLAPNEDIDAGDVIAVNTQRVMVTGVSPQYSISGRVDHLLVEGTRE